MKSLQQSSWEMSVNSRTRLGSTKWLTSRREASQTGHVQWITGWEQNRKIIWMHDRKGTLWTPVAIVPSVLPTIPPPQGRRQKLRHRKQDQDDCHPLGGNIYISQPRSAASLECFPADQIRLWTAIWLIYPARVSSFFFCCVVQIFFAAFLKINANVQTGFLVIFIFDSWSRVRSGFLGREVLPATLQPFCYFVTRAAPKRMRKSE